MIKEKSLVVYRNRPALVSGFDGEKINIAVLDGESARVRAKDIEVIHPGPAALKDLEPPAPEGNVREAWELLADDASAAPGGAGSSRGISLKELAELIYGSFTPGAAWAAYETIKRGLYFSGDTGAVRARPRGFVEEEEKKRDEKQRESGERAAFIEKLKKLPAHKYGDGGPDLSGGERRFLLDVEALALGKSDKSRTLKDLGKPETPEDAHRLLLASGLWDVWVNPHPGRFGLSRESPKIIPPPPPDENRLDLTHLAAYAIDNPWSSDPDDAVSLEISAAASGDASGAEKYVLWVHVADPASSVYPGSPADIEARGRGATLYLPEGASLMLSREALPLFGLGLSDVSPALSVKLSLSPALAIEDTEIFPSFVRVTRLSYAEADGLIASGTVLTALAALAERNIERRLDSGAVMIDLPEAHIRVNPAGKIGEQITVEPLASYRSADMVRECMILAGEGAARWALQRRLAFPYISQEAGELPAQRLPGLAGAFQLRRCMRPRVLSAKPGVHWGLGLDEYTQVTSPLRRYTDLLCHQQIRACLAKNCGASSQGEEPLGEEEVLFRASAAEAAALVTVKAERASRAHWLAVYLSDRKDSVWEAVVLERKGSKGAVIIPALGIETQVGLRGNEEPNELIHVRLSSVKIPEAELYFVPEN